MGHCVQCGSSIPDEQNVCSMCYGDPFYGRDGYYLEWLEHQEREEQRKRWQEEQEWQEQMEQEQGQEDGGGD